MKLLLSFILLQFTFQNILKAQDFAYDQLSKEELDMKLYDKDSSAHAVVLKEFGKTWLSTDEHTPLIHEYHVKIKIFDEQAFNRGTVSIPVYKVDNNTFEQISDIQAVATFKDNDGTIKKTELDPGQVFHVKQNRYWDEVRFAIPGLHKGCIIEYKYRLETPLIWNFKAWEFQDYIPKIYSEYEAHIPAVYSYNVALRGAYKLTKTTSVLEHDCFSTGVVKCDCSKITYIMADIPAFVPETDMTSPKNFMSAINFELTDYYNGFTDAKVKVAKEWKDVDNDLKHSDYFGGQIKRSGLMKDRMQPVIAGKTDELSKAKAIYAYLQKNYKYNGFTGYGSDDGIKKTMDSHSGSVGDINLTLIAALNAVGLNTEAVLLSTRDNGLVNKLYPVVSEFNYVVAKVNIADKSYLLDATDPLLPFGLLPLKCINDQGRVISMDKPSYWIDLTASQKKTKTYAFDLTLQDNGKITGTMINYSSGYEAYDKRKAIKNFNSIDEYVDDLDNKLKKIKILKSDIQNLDSLDLPLTEQYEIEIDGLVNMGTDRIIFNPVFIDRVVENPFKLKDRTYPVDMGALFDDKFTLVLHLPAQLAVESMPQNIALAMPNQGGRFLVNYANAEDGFSFSHLAQFNRSIYMPVEYPALKELFNKMIQAQNGEIILKKNK